MSAILPRSCQPDILATHLNLIGENKMGGFKNDYDPTQDDLDNHANQLNPNNDLYEGDDDDDSDYSQEELDNHANQMNSNNEAYESSRK
ncbi:MAG: hypothetical protein ACR2P9_05255 [Gammaproteobacteria bacterium]